MKSAFSLIKKLVGIFPLMAVLAGLVIAGYTGRGAPSPRQPQNRPSADLAELLRARYASAAKLLEMEEAKLGKGRSTLAVVCEASRRVRDAGWEMSTNREERLGILQTYLESTRRFEQSVSNVAEQGFASASEKELARYLRLDAEIAVLKAKLDATAR